MDNKPMDGQALELVNAVSEILGVPVEELTTRSRKRRYVRARQIVAKIGHDFLQMTQSEAAAIIGRERSAVSYLCSMHDVDYVGDAMYRTLFDRVRQRCT
jgi:chromosomal replication initiation ATPase DnaA